MTMTITMPLLLAAFAAGLFGSVHCIGMCGGIAGMLNAGLKSDRQRRHIFYQLAYNAGRITSYALAGAIAGYIGHRSLAFFTPEHARSIGAAIAGGFMIALGFYIAGWWRGLAVLERGGRRVWKFIEPFSRRFRPIRHWSQALAVGAMWGWLPCGLVYANLAWSLTVGGALNGALLMFAFGLGTLPTLLIVGTTANRLSQIRRAPVFRHAAGAVIIAFGLLMFAKPSIPGHSNHTTGMQEMSYSHPVTLLQTSQESLTSSMILSRSC